MFPFISGISTGRKDSHLVTFISKEIGFTSSSSRMGIGFAICSDAGTHKRTRWGAGGTVAIQLSKIIENEPQSGEILPLVGQNC